MKTLSAILKNQVVRIDNHKSGTREAIKWGAGVHIHKIMNDKKYKGAEFTLPLDREGEINYIKGNTKSIENEIRKAFKDDSVRSKFIQSFGKALNEIAEANRVSTEFRVKILTQSSRQLIELFGMDYEAKKDWFKDEESFMSMFVNSQQEKVYIEQNTKKYYITMSDNEKYLDLFDSIVKNRDKYDENDMGL